jgi:hypothetical protein
MNKTLGIRFAFAALISSAAISGLLMWFGYGAFVQLSNKAQAQGREIETVQRFIRERGAVEHVQKRFNEAYRSADQLVDWRGVIAAVNFPETGLDVDPDALTVSLSPLPGADSAELGLYRACVSNQGGGMLVKAKSYQELFEGIKKVLARIDFEVDTIALTGDRFPAQASISPLCMLFRTDGEGAKK